MYSVPGDDRDPVKLYKIYAEKRPTVCLNEDSPFYIAPRTTPVDNMQNSQPQWFINQKVGSKKLGGMLKRMASEAGLNPNKNITNHSARKHLIQKLRNSNVAPTDIMAISGHKNVQSILNYSEISEEKQIECSNLLSSNRIPSATVTSPDQYVPINNRNPSATVTSPVSVNGHLGTSNTTPTTQVATVDFQPDQSRYPTHSQQIAVQSSNNTLNSLFYGAVLHINNMNVYGNP